MSEIADRLIAAYEGASMLDPITDSDPSFDLAAAYAVLDEIHSRRVGAGWRPVGRKIGFTNRAIWERYGVDAPLWAHVYDRTVHRTATLSLAGLVQPRLEPEVVLGLRGPVPQDGDARAVLDAVEWIAAGFEVVQCHFPDWRFRLPDCTAAFGLHAALFVGASKPLDDGARDRIADFELTLFRDGELVGRGHGRNVLDSPALALQHLARVAVRHPLRAGEIVTTGTLTDAWPLEAGQRWRSDYAELGVEGIELEVTHPPSAAVRRRATRR